MTDDEGSRAATSATSIELIENFYINNKGKSNVKIQVKLNGAGVYLRRETDQNDHINEQLIRLEDIVGSCCGPRIKKRARAGGLSACKRATEEEEEAPAPEPAENKNGAKPKAAAVQKDSSAYLYIYAYIKQEKPLRRNQTVRILRFRSHERYDANLKSAERWHRAIKANKNASDGHSGGKQLLILLNPKSGKGKGRQMFQTQVAPVLKQAECAYELQVTTHPNHARDLVRTRKDLLQRYSGIVVASGDGLFYEVLNGLMERADWRQLSRQLPMGIIPCGSGNGLAKSVAHAYNEPYDSKPIVNATLTCVSGKSAPLDVVRLELAKGDKRAEMYSFLSVGWGLIADIDIESERLRSIGSPRFTIWSVRRLISLRTYRGRLSWLPWQKKPEEAMVGKFERSRSLPLQGREKVDREAATMAPEHQLQQQQNRQSGTKFHDLPDACDDITAAELNDDFTDAVSASGLSFQPPNDSWHSAMSRRTAYYSIAGQSLRSHRSITASLSSMKIKAANAELEALAPAPVSSIPPLQVPLPAETWRSEEGDFVMVHAAYTTHLASDCLFVPDSRLDDGIIYLVIIRAGVSRSELMHFLLSLEKGTHLPEEPNEYIEIVACSAFRIEPQGGQGIITVDGERVDYGPIQGEMFPGMIRVMVPSGK